MGIFFLGGAGVGGVGDDGYGMEVLGGGFGRMDGPGKPWWWDGCLVGGR